MPSKEGHQRFSVSERALVENEVMAGSSGGADSASYMRTSATDTQIFFNQSSSRSGFSIFESRTSFERLLMIICGLLFSFLVVLVIAFGFTTSTPAHEKEICMTETCVMIAGQILSKMDKNVDPCDDFYSYSCGRWVQETLPPNGFGTWTFFTELTETAKLKTKSILDDWSTKFDTEGALTDSQSKTLTYYRSCLSENNMRESLGIAPLEPILQYIFVNNTVFGENEAVAGIPFKETDKKVSWQFGNSAFYEMAIFPNNEDTSRNILTIAPKQELALGPCSVYQNLTVNSTDIRVLAYKYAMKESFSLLAHKMGIVLTPDVQERIESEVDNLFQVEISLANIMTDMDSLQKMETSETYKIATLGQLKKNVTSVDWDGILSQYQDLEITDDEPVQIFDRDFFNKFDDFIARSSNEDLHNYQYWKILFMTMDSLSNDFALIEANLTSQVQGGDNKFRPRWESCIDPLNDGLPIGNVVGAAFIKKFFNAGMKEDIQAMIQSIRDAFITSLPSLDWLDDKTRKAAVYKAQKMQDFFAFPDNLLDKDYVANLLDGVQFDRDQWLLNELRLNNFTRMKEIGKLREPVDKKKWEMTPQTINAYYAPASNSFTFPAGIFQKPFYSPDYPMSFNYGGIGVVIGHELTHGFDTQGRTYDAEGNQNDWFDRDTAAKFNNLSECFVEQYQQYELYGLHVDGIQTLGENMADNGGIKSSYRAYKKFASQRKEEPMYPGLDLSHDQLFFLAFGQMWCIIQSEESARYRLESDAHTPEKYRVPGAVSNLKEFAEAFNCPKNSPMNPAKKCSVW